MSAARSLQMRLSPGADDMELVHLADSIGRPPLGGHDAEAARPHACRGGSDHNDSAAEQDSRQEPEGSSSQEPPSYKLSFRNIVYSVKPRRRGSKRLTILDDVSGHCRSSRVLAVMGRSGAGKTTLLDVLACNVSGGRLAGSVMLNGAACRPADFRKLSCYVMQRDVLLDSATVKEALLTSALLQLPMSMGRRAKEARVNDVLEELDLQDCANTIIGDETAGHKGVSGGQRRRIGIGLQLVRDPRLVFLDEPTSGLDSDMATQVMDTLTRIARRDRLVVCTIHQPSSDITDRFDDLLLLAGGKTAYFGPWSDAVDHFGRLGFQCPMFKNPTDYFMHVVADKSSAAQLVQHFAQQWQHTAAVNVLEAGGAAALEDSAAAAAADGAAGADMSSVPNLPATAPFYYQVWVLGVRFMRSWWRNSDMFWSEMADYAVFSVFLGLLYLRMGSKLPTDLQDRVSGLFYGLAVVMFTPSYTALVVWDKERLLLRRETATGAYKVSAFFIAKSCTMAPIEVLQILFFSVIVYFMTGYQASFSKFAIYYLVFALFALTSETVGHLCAIVTKTSHNGIILVTMILVVCLSFSGYLVSNVPVYFRWIGKVSYFSYAYAAMVRNELDGLTFTAPDGAKVAGSTLIPHSLQNSMGVTGNVLVLLGITLGTRLLAFGMTEVAARFRLL